MRDKSLRERSEFYQEQADTIQSYLTYCRESGKTQKYQITLLELFFEYRMDGLRSKDALQKAKKVLSSFKI